MSYVKRRGMILNPLSILFSMIVIVVIIIRTDWEHQYETIRPLNIDVFLYNYEITILVMFFLFSLILILILYPLIRMFSPIIGLFISKIYFAGSQVFLDKEISKSKIGLGSYMLRYLNLATSLFAMDFLICNSLFDHEGEFPSIYSAIYAVLILAIVQILMWILEDIGIRIYKETSSEISSPVSFLDRFVLKFIQASSLIGSLAVVTLNEDIIDSIPVQIRIIFVRSFLIAIFIKLIYTSFFQSKANIGRWKDKGITMGKVSVKFYKTVVPE